MLQMQSGHLEGGIGTPTRDQAAQIHTAPTAPQPTVRRKPPFVKKRAKQVDPSKGRCLIQNVPRMHGVAYTHCVPIDLREWDDDLLTKVEWYWGMRYFMLNLDTRYNVFPASTSLRDPRENRKIRPMWFLLPEHDTVQRFHDTLTRSQQDDWTTTRGSFPKFQESLFKYRLIPMPGEMQQIIIVHQDLIPPPGQSQVGPKQMSMHTYPFRTLPFLSSHLRPEFAILEAGRQLYHLPEAERIQFIRQVPLLEQISNIYSAWTTQLPPHAMEDESFTSRLIPLDPSQPNVLEDDALSTTSGCTFPGRFDQGHCACFLNEHGHIDGNHCFCMKRRQLCPRHRDCEVVHSHVTAQDENAANGAMWSTGHVRSWSEECFAHSHEWENELSSPADWNVDESDRF